MMVLVQIPVFAGAPVEPSFAPRHKHDAQKLQCMKRLMSFNRKIFYVDAARICESPASDPRARTPAPALVATVTPPRP